MELRARGGSPTGQAGRRRRTGILGTVRLPSFGGSTGAWQIVRPGRRRASRRSGRPLLSGGRDEQPTRTIRAGLGSRAGRQAGQKEEVERLRTSSRIAGGGQGVEEVARRSKVPLVGAHHRRERRRRRLPPTGCVIPAAEQGRHRPRLFYSCTGCNADRKVGVVKMPAQAAAWKEQVSWGAGERAGGGGTTVRQWLRTKSSPAAEGSTLRRTRVGGLSHGSRNRDVYMMREGETTKWGRRFWRGARSTNEGAGSE